ncbi:MAG TPA: sugar phosphate isomerase/epimerase [Spirochaetes bacterium]|nr:sugar phosphate isomerase/epimerase [Spirochaetota bacterium]
MKIKFGVNTLVWVLDFSEKGFSLLEKTKNMGFDAIELTPGDEFRKMDPEKLHKKLDELGLEVSLCGIFNESNDISTDDAVIRQRGIDYMRDYTDWGKEIGARIIGGPLFSALGKKRYLPDEERKAEWDRSADSLKRIGEDAAKKGFIIAMEPINRFEIDMINTASQAIQMCEQVDNPSIKMMLDTFHMNIEDINIGDEIRASKKHLVHFHTCANHRGVPGNDHIPWGEVNKALNDIDYEGYGVIESFAQGEVAAFANIWRPLVEDQDDIPREGLKFLRKALK